MMIGFTSLSTFHVRLSNGNNQNSLLNLHVHIRDKLDSIKEYNITTPVYIHDGSTEIENLFNSFKESKNDLGNNSFVHELLIGNQNVIGQIINSISQQFNKMNIQNLDNAVSSK